MKNNAYIVVSTTQGLYSWRCPINLEGVTKMRNGTHDVTCISASALLVATVIALITISFILPGLSQCNATASPASPSKPQATLILPNLTVTPLRNLPHVSKLVIPPTITGRGVITMIGSAEDALKRGLGVVQISVIKPKRIHVTPGKPAVVEIEITYRGGPSAPAAITLSLGSESSFESSFVSVSYMFVPSQNVDLSRIPLGMKLYTIRKPIVYTYTTAGNGTSAPQFMVTGYRETTGYYVPSYELFRFNTSHIIIHKNSSAIIKAKLIIPDYVRSGTYYVSPSIGVGGEGLDIEEDDTISVTVCSGTT